MPATYKAVRPDDLLELTKYLRLLVWSEPGQGKTTMLASACLSPLTAPMLFIDYKSQVGSLASNPEYMAAMRTGDLMILSLTKYDDLEPIIAWLKGGRGSNGQLDKYMPPNISDTDRQDITNKSKKQWGI